MRIVLSCGVVLGLMGSLQAQSKPVGVPYGSAIDMGASNPSPVVAGAAPTSGTPGTVPYSSYLSPTPVDGSQPYTPFVSDPNANSSLNPNSTPAFHLGPDSVLGPNQSMPTMWFNADYALWWLKRQAVIPPAISTKCSPKN